jgi:hypothetical protein
MASYAQFGDWNELATTGFTGFGNSFVNAESFAVFGYRKR